MVCKDLGRVYLQEKRPQWPPPWRGYLGSHPHPRSPVSFARARVHLVQQISVARRYPSAPPFWESQELSLAKKRKKEVESAQCSLMRLATDQFTSLCCLGSAPFAGSHSE